MTTNISTPTGSINPQAISTLNRLLGDLKARPSSPKPEDWNLAQLDAAKSKVIPRYRPAFSPANVRRLSGEVFLEFLQFQHNLHWRGLDRHGAKLTRDMVRLREALALLVDEDRPLKDRLEQLRPVEGRALVPFLGPAVITAILHVVYPDRYGVLNNVSRAAMIRLGIWPQNLRRGQSAGFADQYLGVNPVLLALALELEIDLWTLDYLWWYVAPSAETETQPEGSPGVESERSPSPREVPTPALDLQGARAPSKTFNLAGDWTFSFEEAESRLQRFCRAEYAYYDAIVDLVPARIEPIDVLATVAMNSRVNEAALIRSVHRGLAGRCNTLLARFPVNADLMTYDPDLGEFRELIHAAVQTPKVLVAVATKVLHRKRRNFIPMLDSLVISHYAKAMNRPDWVEESQFKSTAADVAVGALKAFREDLRQALPQINALRTRLANSGFDMTPVRILEVLIWIEREPNGLYRSGRS